LRGTNGAFGLEEITLDILRLLEQLDKMVLEEPKIWGPITWGLNHDDVKMQIAKIRASLPQELKQAVAKVRESERIVDSAKEDAVQTIEQARREADRLLEDTKKEVEKMIAEAQVRQERMVSESEIIKLAKAQADEIRNLADRDAVQLRRGAEKYALDILGQLENVTGKIIRSVEEGKAQLDRPSPESAVIAPRERIRV
jgi:cell division septum initiation protein DivIVA